MVRSEAASDTWLSKNGRNMVGKYEYIPRDHQVANGCRSLSLGACEQNGHWSVGGDNKGQDGDWDWIGNQGEDGKARRCRRELVQSYIMFQPSAGLSTECVASGKLVDDSAYLCNDPEEILRYSRDPLGTNKYFCEYSPKPPTPSQQNRMRSFRCHQVGDNAGQCLPSYNKDPTPYRPTGQNVFSYFEPNKGGLNDCRKYCRALPDGIEGLV